jgi:hypothetical protein
MITSVKKILYYDEFGLIREVAKKIPLSSILPRPRGRNGTGNSHILLPWREEVGRRGILILRSWPTRP